MRVSLPFRKETSCPRSRKELRGVAPNHCPALKSRLVVSAYLIYSVFRYNDKLTPKQVKHTLASDPRYTAIASSSRREDLYKKWLLKASAENPAITSTQDKSSVALHNRQAKVQASLAKINAVNDRSRSALGREEADLHFRTLLIDKVHDPSVRKSQNASFSSEFR